MNNNNVTTIDYTQTPCYTYTFFSATQHFVHNLKLQFPTCEFHNHHIPKKVKVKKKEKKQDNWHLIFL